MTAAPPPETRAIDVLVQAVHGAARAEGRRIRVRFHGPVPDQVRRAAFASGAVASATETDHTAHVLVVALEDDTPLRVLGYEHATAVVIFDPRTARPVDVRRRLWESWGDHQVRVLPLEGPDALTEGVAVALRHWDPRVPRIAVSMPVNMEGHDVERVLASFLPVCQEWVVGVDEKSTDGTLAAVERYAEVCYRFRIEPWSFAAARNGGIDRCSSPWIFSTEGHEHLDPACVDAILAIGRFGIQVGTVQVDRDTGGQVFQVPSIFRNHPALRFTDTNGVHNTLEVDAYGESERIPGGTCFRPPAKIRTVHKAHPENRELRALQREAMNPKALDEYSEAGGPRKARALFYSAQEHWSAGRPRVAVRRMVEYLRAEDGFAEQVYEAHVMLAEWLLFIKHPRLAIAVGRHGLRWNLHRVEMEILLADAHATIGDDETARQLYAKAAGVPLPAHSLLFLRKDCYQHLPWRGLAAAFLRMGENGNALRAARCGLSFGVEDEVCTAIEQHLAAAGVA